MQIKKILIILGYSLNSDCSMHPLLVARLDKALAYYQPGTPLIVSGKMPLEVLKSDRCLQKTEAQAMKEYLLKKGVQSSDILMEELSLTTFTNAYYSRLLHLDPLKVKNITVISNDFHMELIQYVFKKVLGPEFELQTISAPNDGLTSDELKRYRHILHQLVVRCYPIIFSEIKDGDMQALHAIVNEMEKDPTHQKKRSEFENSLRELLSIDENTHFKATL